MAKHTVRKHRARKPSAPRGARRGGSPDPTAYQTAEHGGYFGTKLPHQKPTKFHKIKPRKPKATHTTTSHHTAAHHKTKVIPTFGSLPVSGGGSTWQHKHLVQVELRVAPHRHPNTHF